MSSEPLDHGDEQTADPSFNLHKNPAVNFGGNPIFGYDFMQQTGVEHDADSGAAPDPASGDPGEDPPSPAAPDGGRIRTA